MNEHATEVLVVDDDPTCRTLAAHVLREAGFGPCLAESGEEAWAMLQGRPDLRLVVCDWNMPGMSGIDLIRKIRADADRKSTFVLICTSNAAAEHIAAGYAAGADDYVTKPWRSVELVARVRSGQQRIALDTSEALIFSLAALAESRDPETGAHLARVQRYCRMLASVLAADSEYGEEMDAPLVHLIEQTSILHDIGKVGIPDAILRKPARLSPSEFDIMKAHTTIGAKALNTALNTTSGPPFLRVAHDIALSHHERWDGSGYPFGMANRQIPLPARILAVTSQRVYKDVIPHDRATEIIIDGAGSQFDPVVIDAFAAHADDFRRVRTEINDESRPECQGMSLCGP